MQKVRGIKQGESENYTSIMFAPLAFLLRLPNLAGARFLVSQDVRACLLTPDSYSGWGHFVVAAFVLYLPSLHTNCLGSHAMSW